MRLAPESPGRELGYATVESTQTISSATPTSVAGWALSVVGTGKPVFVEVWASASAVNNTVGSGTRWQLVRTDTNTTLGDFQTAPLATANQQTVLPPMKSRVVIPLGTTATFQVKIATKAGGGTSTFGASADSPLAIRATGG